jgi:hypothetical protein
MLYDIDWRNNLSALPDIAKAENVLVILENGDTVIKRKILKFVQFKIKETDPVMFSDSEGSWFVVYGLEGGPYKRRA